MNSRKLNKFQFAVFFQKFVDSALFTRIYQDSYQGSALVFISRIRIVVIYSSALRNLEHTARLLTDFMKLFTDFLIVSLKSLENIVVRTKSGFNYDNFV